MEGFKSKVESNTIENANFLRALYTSKNSQVGLMSLTPNEEIGLETHSSNDLFLRVERGKGMCITDDSKCSFSDGSRVIVPVGAGHNNDFVDGSAKGLQALFVPASDGWDVRAARHAETDEEEFKGEPTE